MITISNPKITSEELIIENGLYYKRTVSLLGWGEKRIEKFQIPLRCAIEWVNQYLPKEEKEKAMEILK